MTDTAIATEAHARRTDGDTSHEAAASVINIGAKHDAVLLVLRNMRDFVDVDDSTPYADGMTHPQLVEWYEWGRDRYPRKFPAQTEQSIRSRCAELVAAGIVVDTGIRKALPTGRRAKVWAPAPDAA